MKENNNKRIMSAKERNKLIACRLGNTVKEYSLDHKCFGIEEIPSKVCESKHYVKSLINPDILEMRPKAWNPSCRILSNNTDFENKKDMDKVLFEVKTGLTDVQLIDLKEPLIYPGTEVRDLYYFLWNSSTKLENKDFKKRHDIINNKAKKHVLINNKNIVKNNTYKNPFERGDLVNKYMREIKLETTKLRDAIRNEIMFKYPDSKKECIDAKVFKKLQPLIKEAFNNKTNHREHLFEKIKKNKQNIEGSKIKNVDYTKLNICDKNLKQPSIKDINNNKSIYNIYKKNINNNIEELNNEFIRKTTLVEIDNNEKNQFNTYKSTINNNNNNYNIDINNVNSRKDCNSKKYGNKYTNKKFPHYSLPWNSKSKNCINKDAKYEGRYTDDSKFVLNNKVPNNLLSSYDYQDLANRKYVIKPKDQELPIIFNYYHPGVYRFINNITKDNEIWSCCLNSSKDAVGCRKEHISGGKKVFDIVLK